MHGRRPQVSVPGDVSGALHYKTRNDLHTLGPELPDSQRYDMSHSLHAQRTELSSNLLRNYLPRLELHPDRADLQDIAPVHL